MNTHCNVDPLDNTPDPYTTCVHGRCIYSPKGSCTGGPHNGACYGDEEKQQQHVCEHTSCEGEGCSADEKCVWKHNLCMCHYGWYGPECSEKLELVKCGTDQYVDPNLGTCMPNTDCRHGGHLEDEMSCGPRDIAACADNNNDKESCESTPCGDPVNGCSTAGMCQWKQHCKCPPGYWGYKCGIFICLDGIKGSGIRNYIDGTCEPKEVTG